MAIKAEARSARTVSAAAQRRMAGRRPSCLARNALAQGKKLD
jgi:hypothetical protein